MKAPCPSLCLSVCLSQSYLSTSACRRSGFAAVRPAGRRYRSIAAAAATRRSAANASSDDDDDDDDDDDGRINFNVAYSPKTARTRNS